MASMHPFHRTELVVGGEGFERLRGARVCVVGLGGVGSYAAEALVRAGIGHVTMVDHDRVCVTNLNRQLHAMRSTVNRPKVEVMAERARDINPKADIRPLELFFGRDTHAQVLDREYDYVLDCIDNMTAKIELLARCVRAGQPVLSCFGAGGRMDPTRIRVTDIAETKNDPFGRLVRQLLRDWGIERGIEVVWTDEPPLELDPDAQAAFRCICPVKDPRHGCDNRHQVQGSVPWIPAMFGLAMAGTAVSRILDRPIASADAPRRDERMTPSRNKPSRDRKKALLEEAGFTRSDRDPATSA
jgi:tRNA A37 threonylcarbamoyladenosine dehydratase